MGGATFGAAIEHVAEQGLVVNLATGGPDEVISFRAARFDRAPGARIYTLNLFDELPRLNAANALARLVCPLEARKLTAPIELEMAWHEIHVAINALMTRTISGKAVLIRHSRLAGAPGRVRTSPEATRQFVRSSAEAFTRLNATFVPPPVPHGRRRSKAAGVA